MIPVESILAFVVASALLGIAPGPDNVFVLTQSALYGKKSGVLVTLGLCTGLLVHTAVVALGVAIIFQTSVLAFTILKTVGVLYLLYLAWQAFRAKGNNLNAPCPRLPSGAALYRRGIIMNITNPKVSIFFLAFLPQFSSPEQGAIAPQIIFLGCVFILVALVVFGGIAVMGGVLGAWFQNSPRAQQILNRVAAVVFVGLAIKLAASSIDGE